MIRVVFVNVVISRVDVVVVEPEAEKDCSFVLISIDLMRLNRSNFRPGSLKRTQRN